MSSIISVRQKALALNSDETIYGTFAEIGAGQEVARHFFQAGRASQTVAKTISAYDMTFSDSIYGKSSRYVSEERVRQMVAYEFDLLNERLQDGRGKKSRFFSFADTVSTSSRGGNTPHGWMGIRFNNVPGCAGNDIIIHVKIKDPGRLQQQEALGILGVNLVYAAFFSSGSADELTETLFDGLSPRRVEIDIVRLEGSAFKGIDNKMVALQLVQKGFSQAALINPKGEVMQVTDCFFNKPIIIQRGTFRPITNINLEIINKGIDQINKEKEPGALEPFPLLEMSLRHDMHGDKKFNLDDYLFRAKSIGAVGYYTLISNFDLFYQVKNYLRESTNKKVAMVLGASQLEKVFDEEFYKDHGGVFKSLANLFDANTQVFVFPFKDDQICLTSKSFNPDLPLVHLYKHLMANQFVVDIAGCDDLDTSIHSKEVRRLLRAGDKRWMELVPEAVSELIIKHEIFS